MNQQPNKVDEDDYLNADFDLEEVKKARAAITNGVPVNDGFITFSVTQEDEEDNSSQKKN